MLHNAKSRHRRTIVYLTIAVLLVTGGILPTPFPSLVPVSKAQSCSPPGGVVVSGRSYYSYIANGLPSDTSCWTPTTDRVAVVPTTTCGWSSNAFEFYYAGGISQTFTVPSDLTQPNFSIQYLLDFIDPNDDAAWNRFEMYVDDLTTGATLAYDSFNGSMGDLYCSYRSFSWSQNLAGHQIRVRFKGSRGYNNTFIRVRNIALFQNIAPA